MKKLFAGIALVLAMQGAESVKMCQRPDAGTYAYNESEKIWAAGVGCGESYFGNGNGSKTSDDPSTFCTTRYISGIAKYLYANISVYDITMPDGAANVAGVPYAAGVVCWCKMTWPVAGKWIRHVVMEQSDSCARYCGRLKGNSSSIGAYLY
ncbi:MAG: hypothetical protein LBL46_04820 [Rickettsiales bacterium]|jgi:hypothetical protein|nr:hypothetical protein [Rickettsiales bacterium]